MTVYRISIWIDHLLLAAHTKSSAKLMLLSLEPRPSFCPNCRFCHVFRLLSCTPVCVCVRMCVCVYVLSVLMVMFESNRVCVWCGDGGVFECAPATNGVARTHRPSRVPVPFDWRSTGMNWPRPLQKVCRWSTNNRCSILVKNNLKF